jgi:formylglycine-generating enzyme required for sulfatase activity
LAKSFPPGRQTQPRFWLDPTFNNPSQPVGGICWFEARAYCAWLSAQTSQRFRLPTEVEWEAAARGKQGRRYAFGDDFDASRCNTLETHIRRATPIGVFPGGVTPEGIVDLTGNVWEWTSSQPQPYPYTISDNRENHKDDRALRVLRGGSCGYFLSYARAFYRFPNVPGFRLGNAGLRVVREV